MIVCPKYDKHRHVIECPHCKSQPGYNEWAGEPCAGCRHPLPYGSNAGDYCCSHCQTSHLTASVEVLTDTLRELAESVAEKMKALADASLHSLSESEHRRLGAMHARVLLALGHAWDVLQPDNGE